MSNTIWSKPILKHIISMLGDFVGDGEDDQFQTEIAVHINGAFGRLMQVGVGNPDVYIDKDSQITWDDFIPPDIISRTYILSMVVQYTFLNVKILFDPPAPSTLTVMNNTQEELLWRIKTGYSVVKEG